MGDRLETVRNKQRQRAVIRGVIAMAYSKDELYACICGVMADSLPDSWHTAHMTTKIVGNEIDSIFRFVDSGGAEEQRFVPEQAVAAMNASMELKAIMADEGSDWTTLTVRIFVDGRYEVFTE